jgi:hypothetical protein
MNIILGIKKKDYLPPARILKERLAASHKRFLQQWGEIRLHLAVPVGSMAQRFQV